MKRKSRGDGFFFSSFAALSESGSVTGWSGNCQAESFELTLHFSMTVSGNALIFHHSSAER